MSVNLNFNNQYPVFGVKREDLDDETFKPQNVFNKNLPQVKNNAPINPARVSENKKESSYCCYICDAKSKL